MTATEQSLRYLASASDFEAVRVFEFFARRISNNLTESREEVIANLPEDLQVVDGVEVVSELEMHAEEQLSTGASVKSARSLLALAAQDAALASVVQESFECWQDDRQLVDVILAIGLVGSLWMILASSKIVAKDGKFVFEKGVNKPEQLKALAEVIRAIRGNGQSKIRNK